MANAQKVWCPDDEVEPEGLTNLTTAPTNWFCEEPAYAAELYGLERGVSYPATKEYLVHVLDEAGILHKFNVKVGRTLFADVRSIA